MLGSVLSDKTTDAQRQASVGRPGITAPPSAASANVTRADASFPLAVEGSKQFGQRARLQVYGNGVMLVGFGLDDQQRETVEVHCYYTTGFLITMRGAPTSALDALRQAWRWFQFCVMLGT